MSGAAKASLSMPWRCWFEKGCLGLRALVDQDTEVIHQLDAVG